MPDQPGEDVYRAAARALVTAQGGHMRPSTRDTFVRDWVRRDDFRAAVDVVWRLGRGVYQDIAEAAIAYTTEPEGSDQVEHYWWQLKDAVKSHLKERE